MDKPQGSFQFFNFPSYLLLPPNKTKQNKTSENPLSINNFRIFGLLLTNRHSSCTPSVHVNGVYYLVVNHSI